MQLHVAENQTMVHNREQVRIMIVMVFFRSRVSPPGWTTATPPVEKRKTREQPLFASHRSTPWDSSTWTKPTGVLS